MLNRPYVGVPLTILHTHVRLNWAHGRWRCILDNIKMKLYSWTAFEIT